MLPRRLLLAAPLAACAAPAAPTTPGPQGAEGWEMREQLWRIPVPDGPRGTVLLEATLYRPPGPGPFPLALVSHGQPGGGEAARRSLARPRYRLLSAELLAQGFAVLLPVRRGFGASGGEFAGSTGGCARMALEANAEAGAADIAACLAYARAAMPMLEAGRVLLAGQSAGGFASLAAAGRPGLGAAGVLNFSGGLRAGRGGLFGGSHCAGWQERLVQAMAALGGRPAARRVPTLWLYAVQDSYFGHGLAPRLCAAWVGAGGRARYAEIAAPGRDGHGFVEDPEALGLWRGPVQEFLAGLRAGRQQPG
ncbi:alpha/beta hydrolase family protein [Siccirubricoccus phaeus]|uniref:alpha/beta hydrolase family protein n=1 Tax=Siccirubricoccus phaeus TaxID=2595053 RepID=UPI0011F25BD3|nr:CocE/NonD family hydrolase [Siccirubricoccus phaeus]